MPKSKNEQLRKWVGRVGWIATIASKFVPGKTQVMMVAVSTIAGGLVALLDRCDQNENPPASIPSPTEVPTIVPTEVPTRTPTPRPPRILIDRTIVSGSPFTVQYTAPFQYNTHLWADNYRLGYMGRDVDNTHVLYAVVLRSTGERVLTVRNDSGEILASKNVQVIEATN